MKIEDTITRTFRISKEISENLYKLKNHLSAKNYGEMWEKILVGYSSHGVSYWNDILRVEEKSYEAYVSSGNFRQDVANTLKSNVENAKRKIEELDSIVKFISFEIEETE